MRKIAALLLVMIFSGMLLSAKNTKQPNIIFIICDQMRADAFGAAGNKHINTPNLDRMASQGTLFTNAYSNSPVCLPSRVSMFSGKYPSETNVFVNFHPGDWLPFEHSMPWHLRQAGYYLGYVGKNHAFIKEDLKKFDELYELGREKCRNYSPFIPPNWHSDIFWPEEDCNPVKNTDNAIDFIQRNSGDRPFFLTVSYFDPHPPYMAPAEYTSKYCAADMVLPESIDPSQLGQRISDQQKALRYDKQTEADIRETMRYYYAAIEWGVDKQVGRLLQTLEEQGIADNTIIVFTSDHGDFMGELNMVRKGLFLYDALLHIPMLWYAPGIIEPQRLDRLSENVNISPTLLDYAGVEQPQAMVGQSLRPLLSGKRLKAPQYLFAAAAYSLLPVGYWEHPEPYYQPKSDVPFHSRIEKITWQDEYKTAMVRSKDWKLIVSQTHAPELYAMQGANVEHENLFGDPQYQAIFETLKAEMIRRWDIPFQWTE